MAKHKLIMNLIFLTLWGRVMHICVSNLTIIGSDNGLSPGRRQTIVWTNAGILLTGLLGRNFSEISIKSLIFLFKKMHLNVSSAKWRAFCVGLNVLMMFWRFRLLSLLFLSYFNIDLESPTSLSC